MPFPLSLFGTSAAAGGGAPLFPQNYVYNAEDCRLQSDEGDSSVKSGLNQMLLMSFWVQATGESGNDDIKLVGLGVGDGNSDSLVEASIDTGVNPAGFELVIAVPGFPLYSNTSTDKFNPTRLNHILVAWNATVLQVYLNDEVLTMPGTPLALDVPWQDVNTTSVGAFVNDGGGGGGGPRLGVAAYGSVWAYAGQYLDLSVEANRRLFINSDLGPVDLGANGELPLGTPPDIYFGGLQTADDWNNAINLGDSPGLFHDGGTLYTEAPPPPTYIQNVVVNNGAGFRNIEGPMAPAASNQFTFSCWYEHTNIATQRRYLLSCGTTSLAANRVLEIWLGNATSTMPITVTAGDGAGLNVSVLNAFSTVNQDFTGEMHNILITRDGATLQVYLDDVEIAMTIFTQTADALIFDTCIWSKLMMDYTSNTFNNIDQIADYWFQTGVALDLSVEANRRLFIDEFGRPVDLGPTGNTPTGTTPNIFFGGDQLAVDWNAADNLGVQTDYILNGGPFTDLP